MMKTYRRLKDMDLKVTPQRQAIMRVLDGNRSHPCVESIFHEVHKEFPGISLATVYNTLSTFAKAGQIQELDIDPTKKRFDPCLAPHGHFYCNVCRKVFDIPHDKFLLGDTSLQKKLDGFHIDTIQINLKGVCKDCRKKR